MKIEVSELIRRRIMEKSLERLLANKITTMKSMKKFS